MSDVERVRVVLGISYIDCLSCKHYYQGYGCTHPKWRPGAGPCHDYRDYRDGIKLIERNGPLGFWEEKDGG